ncbi:4-diphosphocytidyl-2-C-methyl-D-erythritol kinase [Propionispira arboris]|uniref:4-diphosphocytidyl-2-C-methyl-D-erythritol kinase n=1 Tax=Propionispira arboris TaxID=84035 RepID=A0A1H7A3Y1_9FIRM|nr:4-(cytidine 5'-diphospho)-2-C-methyl-D-erythritol kinase [Propionispira arboris]SEJ56560.1 4-diphosphocytidyl-2-C-methyl-D-erythritol kinase [Propionispira arboris]
MNVLKTLKVDAYAKINLTLDILSKRPDGYHEVSMVMQSIGLCDRIKFSEEPKGSGITLVTNVPGLPCGERNLAYRAAKLMMDTYHIEQGIHMNLTKRIPIAAGLAGGSSNAAAVILAMNEMFCLELSREELCSVGEKIGSDIPFCLCGGTMLAEGRGEKLTRLPSMPQCYVILAKPPVKVSTAWAYQNYQKEQVKEHPKTDEILSCLAEKNLVGIGKLLCNVLESVTINRYKEIDMLKKLMLKHGAMASLMSGSGPTVFGLTEDAKTAEHIAEQLRKLTNARIFVTKTVCGN